MDDPKCFLVWMTGGVLMPVSREQAVCAFAELLCIPLDEASSRFSRAPCVVRAGLSFRDASKYQRVLQRRGVECSLLRQEAGQDIHSVLVSLCRQSSPA